MKTKKIYICYDAGCDIWVVEPFNVNIKWHQNEYQGTYKECLEEQQRNEYAAYRFNNYMPHLSNC